MLEKINGNLIFKPLTDEDRKRGILGRLTGPVASCVTPTRNGRKYSDELWEKAFDNPLVREMFKNGGLPGELNHPADRTETDASRIAIMMPEPPKKDKNGLLQASVDIIDTPCGQVAYQLAKYGFKFGISSRGEGEIIEDYSGDEEVDPDTYSLNGFDLVLLPASETARLTFTESLDTKGPILKKAINEMLEKASETDRKIMTESLNELNIDYTQENDNQSTEEVVNDINSDSNTDMAANDAGAELVTELQEAIRTINDRDIQIKKLQEQLSVCYTKESRYSGILGRTKDQLNESNMQIGKLQEQISKLTQDLQEANNTIVNKDAEIKTLEESIKTNSNTATRLTESLNTTKKETAILQKKVSILTEQLKAKDKLVEDTKQSLTEQLNEANIEKQSLTEKISDLEKDSKIIRSQLTATTSKAKELTEKYKTIAKTAVDKYINSQALRYGIKVADIKQRLSESYSFNDIDNVCEQLKTYKINMNSLPFDVNSKPIRVKINESKQFTSTPFSDNGVDDDVDATLLSFLE